jgi:hypothetical protein
MMANLEITNNNPFGLVIWDPVFQDELVRRPAAFTADLILAAGTVLRRDAASGELAPYVQDIILPAEAPVLETYPVAILMEELDLTVADTGVPSRVLVSARVRRGDLLAYPDDTTAATVINDFTGDLLKAADILALNVQQLGELDNQ